MKKSIFFALIVSLLICCKPSKEVVKNPFGTVITDSNAEAVYYAILEDTTFPDKSDYWDQAIVEGSIGNPDAENKPWNALERNKTPEQIIGAMKARELEEVDKLEKQEQLNELSTEMVIGQNSLDYSNGISLKVLEYKTAGLIDERDNHFMASKADDGNVFYIFEYLIENGTSEPISPNPMIHNPVLVDAEGYQYPYDFDASTNLMRGVKPTPVIPSGKARFQIAIEAPAKAKGLKLMPGMIDGTQAYAYKVN